jgi:hypothetical protein
MRNKTYHSRYPHAIVGMDTYACDWTNLHQIHVQNCHLQIKNLTCDLLVLHYFHVAKKKLKKLKKLKNIKLNVHTMYIV